MLDLTLEEIEALRGFFKTRRDLKACWETFKAYGGACKCGETRVTHLTLDHVNGGGTKHRKQMKRASARKGGGVILYKRLRKLGFPNDPPLETMCIKCHEAKDGSTHEFVVARRQRWVDFAIVGGPLLDRLRSLGYENKAIEEYLGIRNC